MGVGGGGGGVEWEVREGAAEERGVHVARALLFEGWGSSSVSSAHPHLFFPLTATLHSQAPVDRSLRPPLSPPPPSSLTGPGADAGASHPP
jgi:hypothetical protein